MVVEIVIKLIIFGLRCWFFSKIEGGLINFRKDAIELMMFVGAICQPRDAEGIGNEIYMYGVILNLFLSYILESNLSSSSD